MSVRTYLQKRENSIFYFRKKMPADMAKYLKKHEFVKSLRTSDRKQAAKIAIEIEAYIEQCLDGIREGKAIVASQIMDSCSITKQGKVLFRQQVSNEITLKELLERRIKKTANIHSKTLINWRLCVRQFTELFGDIDISRIDMQHIIKYRDAIAALPARCTIFYPDKTINELMKIYENKPNTSTVSEKTLSCRILTLKGFLSFACREGLLKENVADSFSVAVSKKGSKSRKTFTASDLNIIFTGFEGHKAWIALLALYTGARLEEIGQLDVQDVKCVDGIYYIDINAENGKRLKNIGSARKIPLHAALIKSGFMDYVELAKSKNGKLFYELPKSKEGRYTKAYSQWFARYIESKGVTDSGKVFHSFRHTFKDACRAAEIPEDIHDALTGHSNGTVSRTYGEGHKIPILNKYLQQIKFEGFEIKKS